MKKKEKQKKRKAYEPKLTPEGNNFWGRVLISLITIVHYALYMIPIYYTFHFQ